MNLSLDANEPFTNAVHTLYFAASQNPLTSNITQLVQYLLPDTRKWQGAGQASVYQNAPSSCLYTNEADLFP